MQHEVLFFSPHFIDDTLNTRAECVRSKKISNDQELIQSDPISCPQNTAKLRSEYFLFESKGIV